MSSPLWFLCTGSPPRRERTREARPVTSFSCISFWTVSFFNLATRLVSSIFFLTVKKPSPEFCISFPASSHPSKRCNHPSRCQPVPRSQQMHSVSCFVFWLLLLSILIADSPPLFFVPDGRYSRAVVLERRPPYTMMILVFPRAAEKRTDLVSIFWHVASTTASIRISCLWWIFETMIKHQCEI